MDPIYFMSRKIQKDPRRYLEAKSLTRFEHFMLGYSFRIDMESWEKVSNSDFRENYDKAVLYGNSDVIVDTMSGFSEFVHSYYNRELTTLSAAGVILENTDSESDAFDKYFELLDSFIKRERDDTRQTTADDASDMAAIH